MNYMGGTFVRQAFQRKIADSNTARLYMEAQGAVFRSRIIKLTLSVHKNKRSNSEITYFKLKYLGAKAWPSAYRFTSIRFLLTGIVAITQGCKGTLLNLSFDYYCTIFHIFIS